MNCNPSKKGKKKKMKIDEANNSYLEGNAFLFFNAAKSFNNQNACPFPNGPSPLPPHCHVLTRNGTVLRAQCGEGTSRALPAYNQGSTGNAEAGRRDPSPRLWWFENPPAESLTQN